MVQDDDAIGIEDRVDPMSDRDNGTIFKHAATQRVLQQSICLDIDGGLLRCQPKPRGTCHFLAYRGFIENQDVGRRQKGSSQ